MFNVATLCRIATHVGSRWYKTGHGFTCDACEGSK